MEVSDMRWFFPTLDRDLLMRRGAADLGFMLERVTVLRAGDGNRTRTISLGIRQIRASERLDLGIGCTASDRDEPCDTRVNGRPMAHGLAAVADAFAVTVAVSFGRP